MSRLSKHPELIICLILTIATLAVYRPVQQNDFVNLDDDHYVTENRHVNTGLTSEGIRWAFTFSDIDYWHPLTWLSHMLDCQLYGLNPKGHHLNNLLLHIANTLLLFLLLKGMTGTIWRSAAVAAMFALHPINVESVAWVAERKSVLAVFFWIVTIGSYAFYSARPGIVRYMMALLSFALGLLSKPMVVTLPFVFILLDYWPLGRFQWAPCVSRANPSDPELKIPAFQKAPVLQLLLEKAPFFILSAASIYASVFSVKHRGIMIPGETVSLWLRIENAFVSYIGYMKKMILPQDLAVFYPYPEMVALWQIAGACLLLVGISVWVVRVWQRLPYLAVGWFWYVGTLVPVIGLLQVGLWPAMADRFAYIPFIGLFIMVVWGLYDLGVKWRFPRLLFPISAGIVFSALMVCTWIQVRHWYNSTTLFQRALSVTTNNHLAHNNLGAALAKQGRLGEAVSHYYEALSIMPNNALFLNNLGAALARQGKLAESIRYISEALRIFPDYAEAHTNMGFSLAEQGKLKEAKFHYHQALRINPHAETYLNLGHLLAKEGKLQEAISYYLEALRIKPYYAAAHSDLGVALSEQGKLQEAVSHFVEALRINPGDPHVRHNLKVILRKLNKSNESQNLVGKPANHRVQVENGLNGP